MSLVCCIGSRSGRFSTPHFRAQEAWTRSFFQRTSSLVRLSRHSDNGAKLQLLPFIELLSLDTHTQHKQQQQTIYTMRSALVVFQSPSRSAPLRRAVGASAPIHGRVVRDTDNKTPLQQRRNYTSLNEKTPFTLCFLRHGQVRRSLLTKSADPEEGLEAFGGI